jgi:uncharacterized protein
VEAVAAEAAAEGDAVVDSTNTVCSPRSDRKRPAWIERLPRLGAGLGFRRPLARDIAAHSAEIGFLEIIAEHYLQPGKYDRRELDELSRRFKLVPHGLSLSPGSAEQADEQYLRGIARLAANVEAPWYSDHLAMTRAGRIDIGHLAPIPMTEEMVEVVCGNIRRAQEEVAAPFIIENIAYTLRLPGRPEMSEAEFLTRVVEETDSGLLLDLMNLHANAQNHGYDPYAFLEKIPIERVVQVHIIGGHYHKGVLVDSHSNRTPEEVWRMLEYVASRTEIRAVLIEWDEQFPVFGVILEELARARDVLAGSEKAAYVGA